MPVTWSYNIYIDVAERRPTDRPTGRPVDRALPVRRAAAELKLTSARESKRKEGDVTSRLRRIKRANCMNRRACSPGEEESLGIYGSRSSVRGCCLRLPEIELPASNKRHRARRKCRADLAATRTLSSRTLVCFRHFRDAEIFIYRGKYPRFIRWPRRAQFRGRSICLGQVCLESIQMFFISPGRAMCVTNFKRNLRLWDRSATLSTLWLIRLHSYLSHGRTK